MSNKVELKNDAELAARVFEIIYPYLRDRETQPGDAQERAKIIVDGVISACSRWVRLQAHK